MDEHKIVYLDILAYYNTIIENMIAAKVDKAEGKQLSTNDFTDAEKNKLANIAANATRVIVENVLTSDSTTNALSAAQGKALKALIDELSDSLSDLGYGDMMKSVYDANNDGIVDNASQLGGQAPAYYAKADGTNIQTAFTPASTRQNITSGEALPAILGKISKFFTDLKTVAFSGSYNDLSNQPTIPTVTNDLTDDLKANYDAAYTHSQSAHAPSNAQANVIEAITVNGASQTPTGKTVNITVPTTVAQLTDAGNYALKSDITNVYRYKGSVATYSALPTEGNVAGDTYDVQDEQGMNYAWKSDGGWDALGMKIQLNWATTADIDAMFE